MVRIHASRVMTDVMNVFIVSNLAHCKHVHGSMSRKMSATEKELTIALLIMASRPSPTIFTHLNFRRESIQRWRWWASARGVSVKFVAKSSQIIVTQTSFRTHLSRTL